MTPRMTTSVSKTAASKSAEAEFVQGVVTETGLGNDIRVAVGGAATAPALATTEPLFAGSVVWMRRSRKGSVLVGTSD